jgi:serine/alanine adding enzyme
MNQEYLLTTMDADQWRRDLPADICVMGSLEYARITERQTGFAGRLFVWKTGDSVIAYPFFIRPVKCLPFVKGGTEARWDIFTPEYTGPLSTGAVEPNEDDQKSFVERFGRFCRKNGILAEFAHLNPWHHAQDLLDPAGIVNNREIVYVDLNLEEDDLWTKSLNSDTRRMTRQAEKAGVQIRRAETLEDVKAFYHLHSATMDRRNALDRYRLPLEYFADFHHSMPDNAFFVLAEYQDQVVAGGLFFQGGQELYWHLSAANMEFSRVRPVDKYVWETIRWAARSGKQRMLLGGGYKKNDGVFRFKAGFSPLRAEFCTYRKVHDEQAYKTLSRAWSAYYQADLSEADFFPAYRSPIRGLQPSCEMASG